MTLFQQLTLPTALIGFLAFLVSCERSTTPDGDEVSTQPKIIFEDDMTGNWQEQWFLDGKEGKISTSENGLLLVGGPVTKKHDRELYHAHHVVLWTKQVFEGDIRIQYEMTRRDTSDYGTTLLYIQAQGIGTEEFPEDITEWNQFREIPNMSYYFNTMDLLSLSFREQLRLKRYPWRHDDETPLTNDSLIEPMGEWDGIQTGTTYHVDVTKRDTSLRALVKELGSDKVIIDQTWDTSDVDPKLEPQLITKGRIGLRHMATRGVEYKNFRVDQL